MSDVRLIDANALKEDLKNMLARVMYESDLDFDHSHARIWTATITGIQHSIKRLDNAPTIDAVEVVRCRKCYYRDKPSCCPYQYSGFKVEPDWYCPMGVKMDAKEEDHAE